MSSCGLDPLVQQLLGHSLTQRDARPKPLVVGVPEEHESRRLDGLQVGITALFKLLPHDHVSSSLVSSRPLASEPLRWIAVVLGGHLVILTALD